MDLKKITTEIADDLDFLKTFTATPGNGLHQSHLPERPEMQQNI